MAAEVLASLAASVKVDGKRRTLRRGEQIPEGLASADRERLSRRGSIVTAAELRRQEAKRTAFKEAGTGSTAAPAAELAPEEASAPVAEAPSVDEILAGTVDEVVGAVGEDKALAERVLAAENAADSPRKGVVEPLTELTSS